MRSLSLSFLFLIFIILGFSRAYIFALGYIWVDLTKPQNLAYSIINNQPLSFVISVFVVASLFFAKRKEKVNINITSILLVLFMVWITATTSGWAVLPDDAWLKWNSAVKSVFFGFLIPYIFRTRLEIEAMLQIVTISIATYYIPDGVKTLFTGGGYGGWTGGSGISESSTLAMICTAMVPINMYLRDNSIIFQGAYARNMHLMLAVLSSLTVFGTFARTGLVVLLLYISYNTFFLSKTKFRNFFVLIFALITASNFVSDSWIERMSTINSYQKDSSAMGRVACWAWTREYVSEHPLGGGFNVYKINEGVYEGIYIHGKAFHNIYFEVLGEHGYPGLIIFLLILLTTIFRFWLLTKIKTNILENDWIPEMAKMGLMIMLIFMVGGTTIGIAFQPYIYYFVGLSIALDQINKRAVNNG